MLQHKAVRRTHYFPSPVRLSIPRVDHPNPEYGGSRVCAHLHAMHATGILMAIVAEREVSTSIGEAT